MNKRIMVLLLALMAVFFVRVAPVEASATGDVSNDPAPCTQHVDANGDCVCDTEGCDEAVHNFGAEWQYNESEHYHKCQNASCNETNDEDSHAYGDDCLCDVCGYEKPHAWENVGRVDSTCLTNGMREHRKCTVCGILYDLTSETPKTEDELCLDLLEHDYNVSWQYDEGDQHYKLCGRDCGTTVETGSHTFEYTDNGNKNHIGWCECGYSVPANHEDNVSDCYCDDCGRELEHRKEYVPGDPYSERSCMEPYTDYCFKCSVCGQLFAYYGDKISAPPVVPARGYHELYYNTYRVEEGRHEVYCGWCSYHDEEPHEMVVNDPLKGNYHQWECICGELKTETHYDKNGDNKCDACAHDMGNKAEKVETHDSVTVKTGEKKAVDSDKSWWQNWQDGLTPSNSGGTTSTEKTVVDNVNNNTGSGSEPATASVFGSDLGSTDTDNDTGSQPENNGSVQQRLAPPEQGSDVGGDNDENIVISETESNVIMQFINWFLGLFGF